MTEPTTPVERYIDCDRHINMAYNTVRALRTTYLDQRGISLTQWHIFNRAPGKTPDQLIRELISELAEHTELIRELAGHTGEHDAAIASAIEQLRERGLITTGTDGALEITTEGQALFQRFNTGRSELLTEFHAGITAEELTTTVRVLKLISEQATRANTRITTTSTTKPTPDMP
jgi:DNA-binding MarR family transcriptional regulator